MTKKEIERKLKRAGWTIQHGANHDKAISPDGTIKIPIPRHKGDRAGNEYFKSCRAFEK